MRLADRFKFLLYFGSDVSREFPDVIGGAVKAVTACIECRAVNANHPATNTVKHKDNNKSFNKIYARLLLTPTSDTFLLASARKAS